MTRPAAEFVPVKVAAGGRGHDRGVACEEMPMPVEVRCRSMRGDEIDAVAAFAAAVFRHSVARNCLERGRHTFRLLHQPAEIARRLAAGSRFLVALTDDRLSGVLEISSAGHLALLFVAPAQRRRGIARRLLAHALEGLDRAGVRALTVSAVAGSVGAYTRLGFHATGPEQAKNGIRFTPMVHPLSPLH